MASELAILVVDDETANLQKLKRTFLSDYLVFEATSGQEALRILRRRSVAAIISDQRMPTMSGVELMKHALEICPDAIRIILTGYTDVGDLIDAINKGHVDQYITKPWEPAVLRKTVAKELDRWRLERENKRLAAQLKTVNEKLERENIQLKREMELLDGGDRKLIFESSQMKDLLSLLDRVVPTDSTVLIQGETGTGKELLARYIYEKSPRKDQAFIPVNCGAIPAELVESSFFGHKKGSFTGAISDKKGLFELADRGVLFLDEIGEAPLELQVKLLRVLQEDEVYPVGGASSRPVDVRIIGSTNRNLGQLVEEKVFRQDLFFRLNVFSVLVPPLRARRTDIPVLVEHFVAKFSLRLNKEIKEIAPEALAILANYDWPGNVRELENEIERIVILCDSGQAIVPNVISERIRFGGSESSRSSQGSLKSQLFQLERQLILEALDEHQQNKSRAAQALGISRQTVIAKLKAYGQAV